MGISKRIIIIILCIFLISILLIVTKSYAQTFPKISGIKTTQLHKNNDPIHRYQLEAVVNNPSNERIEAFWQVTCGKLETDKGLKVVLQYSGDCSEAKATVIVLNNSLYGQKRVQSIFIPGAVQTSDLKPKSAPIPTPSIMPTLLSQTQLGQIFTISYFWIIAFVLLLIAAIFYLAKKKGFLVMLTSSDVSNKDHCSLNDKKDCQYVIFKITVGERPPGLDESIEASINELDYYSYILEWLPTRGTTAAPKCIHEFTETLSRMHNEMRRKNIMGHGANVYGKIRWKECEETGFWFWKKNVWITKEEYIRIDAPIEWAYQHIARPHSWKPDLIFSPQFYMNKENLGKFLDHVKKEALKKCPCPLKDKSI